MARLVWACGLGVLLAAGPGVALAARPEGFDLPVRAMLQGKVAGQAVRVLASGKGALLQVAQAATDSPEKREADRLLNEGIQKFQVSQFREALQSWEAALKLYRAVNNRQGEAKSLGGLGIAYDALMEHEKAINAYAECLVIAREVNNLQIESSSLGGLAKAYYFLGDFQKSIKFNEQKLEISRKINDYQEIANSLGDLSSAYSNLGEYEKSIDLCNECIDIAKKINDRETEAGCINTMATAYYSLSKYEKAVSLYENALNFAREISNLRLEMMVLGNLSNVYQSMAKYDQALDLNRQALTLAEKTNDVFVESTVLGNIGNIYMEIGEYEKSINFYRQALTLKQKINDFYGQAIFLGNLGNVYRLTGKYQDAIKFHRESLLMKKKTGDRQGEGISYGNLANAYNELGQYQQAIDLLNRQLQISRDIKDRFMEGVALGNLGTSYLALSQPKEAIDLFRLSLKIQEEVGDYRGQAFSLNNLGLSYAEIGEYNLAMQFHQQQLDLANKLGIPEIKLLALLNLGSLYEKLEKSDLAMAFHKNALSLSRSLKLILSEGIILNNIAANFAELNEKDLAISFYKQSINIREDIRNKITRLEASQQKSFIESVASTYRNFASLLIEKNRLAEAQQVLELLKAQEIRDFSTTETIIGKKREIALSAPETAVVATFTRLAEATACQEKTTPDCNALLRQKDQIDRDYQTALTALQTESQRLANDPNRLQATPTAQTLVRTQANTALIYYLVLDDKLQLLLVTPDGQLSAHTVPVSREQLKGRVTDLREYLETPSSNLKDFQNTSNQLYQHLIAPIAPTLAQHQIQHLIFSSDRILRYIPMATLWDGQQYLLQRYTIANILGADLTNTTGKMPRPEAANLLAFGLTNGSTPLPGVAPELDAIVKERDRPDPTGLYPGNSFLNEAFTFDNLNRQLPNRNLLHIASHAQFLRPSLPAATTQPSQTAQEDPPVEPYLELGNRKKLPISEAESLNAKLSNIHLVVLSACQTAVPSQATNPIADKFEEGIELLGIYAYFLAGKGANAALATNWQVNDTSTSTLIQDFYRRLATTTTLTKAEALRQSQLAFLTSPPHAHPYYWAPFVLTGNSW